MRPSSAGTSFARRPARSVLVAFRDAVFRRSAPISVYGLKLSLAGEALSSPSVYLLLVAVGRLLKRRFGVAARRDLPTFQRGRSRPTWRSRLLHPALPGRTELGALSALLGTGVLVRLDRPVFLALVFRGTPQGARPEVHPRGHGAARASSWSCCWCSNSATTERPARPAGGFGRRRHRARLRVAGFARQHHRRASRCNSAGRSRWATGCWWTTSTCRRSRSTGARPASSPTTTCSSTCPTSISSGRPSSTTTAAARVHAMRLEIGVDYDVPPNRVKDVLARAAASARGRARRSVCRPCS